MKTIGKNMANKLKNNPAPLKKSTKNLVQRLWEESEKRNSESEIVSNVMPNRCFIRLKVGNVNCDLVEFINGNYIGANFGVINDLQPYEWSINLQTWKPCFIE